MSDVRLVFYAVVNSDEEPASPTDLKKATVYSGTAEQCQRFVRLYPTRRLYIKEIEFVIHDVPKEEQDRPEIEPGG